MIDLTKLLPTAADVLKLSPSELGAYLLEALTADSVNVKDHPKNIRNTIVERWYAGSESGSVVAAVVRSLDILMRDGYVTRTYDDAVDNEWFTLTEKGRTIKRHEQLSTPVEAPDDTGVPLVFVSCGQVSDGEQFVGRELVKLVEMYTDCVGYYAQNQHSLESLSNNILSSLNRCAALVLVMHKRGTVSSPYDADADRGSVWIEQELAMAALLQHTFGRHIIVRAYIQDGIKREGLRTLLHLNETPFTTDDDILADFEARLKDGTFHPRARSPKDDSHNSGPPPQPEAEPYAAQLESVPDLYGQGGVMVPNYIISFRLIVHPVAQHDEIIDEEHERDVVARARSFAGNAFPIEGPECAVNIADGYKVHTMQTRTASHPEFREIYRFTRDGFFAAVRVSPDDIDEDRQFPGNDRFIGFLTLARTLYAMSRFAISLVEAYGVETRAELSIDGLGGHVLRDDTTQHSLPSVAYPPSHQESVRTELSGASADFRASADAWLVDTIAKCLRALNAPMTSAAATTFARTHFGFKS